MQPHKMYYRMLGKTGLQVSVFSYGFWATFGVKDGLNDRQGIDQAKNLLTVCKSAGINLFDNAEVYGVPRGEAERIMGQAMTELRAEDPILWRRSDCIISSKIFWGGDGVNESGLSRKHIQEGMQAILERLQVDYVDLILCHRPDPFTPTTTVVHAMNDMIRRGWATAWGCSEWSAQQITEAHWIAQSLGLEGPSVEQPQYNMLHRDRFETDYAPLFYDPYQIGTTIWSPLASGILTGKYNNGIPANSRMTQPGYEWLHKILAQHKASGTLEKIAQLSDYAHDQLECSMTQLALAWCVKNTNVSTVLLGATRLEQLQENLAALPVIERLTTDHMQAIDTILGNKPKPYQGYRGAGMRTLESI
jgi:voltage-dependent potassium channel beta subunit